MFLVSWELVRFAKNLPELVLYWLVTKKWIISRHRHKLDVVPIGMLQNSLNATRELLLEKKSLSKINFILEVSIPTILPNKPTIQKNMNHPNLQRTTKRRTMCSVLFFLHVAGNHRLYNGRSMKFNTWEVVYNVYHRFRKCVLSLSSFRDQNDQVTQKKRKKIFYFPTAPRSIYVTSELISE